MADDNRQDQGPLSSEALKRDEWRGNPSIVQEEDATGHTLPESERDDGAEGNGEEGEGPSLGTVSPPD